MVNYLTVGYDCSPAAALRNLGIREVALPFDWVQSNIHSISRCFEDNFDKYHTNLQMNYTKTRLIDYYGFQFPHDYPFNNTDTVETDVGEGVFGEEKCSFIKENWHDYYTIVKEKYNRRIERFRTIINDLTPIIVLCRYNTPDVFELQKLFLKHYRRDNIYFVNSTLEKFENNKIINIYTEQNGEWNDATIWKIGIDKMIEKNNL